MYTVRSQDLLLNFDDWHCEVLSAVIAAQHKW